MIGVGVADKVNGTWTDLLVPAGHGASSFAPAKMKANHMNQPSFQVSSEVKSASPRRFDLLKDACSLIVDHRSSEHGMKE